MGDGSINEGCPPRITPRSGAQTKMLGEATSQSPKLLLKKEKAPKSRGKALTFKQKKEIRECFELLEHEEPGFMYPEEFFKSMHALGFMPKDDEADTLFARVSVGSHISPMLF